MVLRFCWGIEVWRRRIYLRFKWKPYLSHAPSGHNVSFEPKFDALSGLYSIKPKLVRLGISISALDFLPNPFQMSVGVSPQIKNYASISGKKKARQLPPSGRDLGAGLVAPLGGKGIVKGDSTSSKVEPDWVEARSMLEVYEAMVLHINDDKQVIL
ncbi:hypothetical protein V6N13_108673 [Hibiscus sabdariffa]